MKQLLSLLCLLLLGPSLSLCFGSLRIINGTAAKSRQLPYQVALNVYFANAVEDANLCGGTIISKRWILTAAHCLQEPDTKLVKIEVLAGSVNKKIKEAGQVKLQVLASAAIVHPQYNRDTVINDIGLIRLPRDLLLNAFVLAAKLPKRNAKETYAGRLAISSGWGLMANNRPANTLQFLSVKIISNTQCERDWNTQLKGKRKFLPGSFLCIDSTLGLPCRGDSGGPLVLDDGSRTVVGIVSHGYDAKCRIRVPDIFTRVSSFVDWIERHTGRLS
ncbi:hypothetical protein KR222_011446 [Zaprionus bogoriensis]|nr:hypothetical protein KR222_011446 [Zaprionus bogoriensis]